MREKLVTFLAQFKEKRHSIICVMLLVFLIGFSQTILLSIPVSLFLEHYSSEDLPIVNMALGLMMFLFGIFFSYIQKKYSAFVSIILPLILFTFFQVFSWQALQLSNPILTFFSYSISLLINFFSLSICLILCYRLFTTNELKRLLGLFFGINGIGGISAGLAVPYLLMVMSFYDVILLGGFSTGLGCFLIFLIRKHSPAKFSEKSPEVIISDSGSLDNSKDSKKYVYIVFSTTVLCFFILSIIEFIFNSEVQRNYTSQLERAIFYSFFNAISNSLYLVFSFIIYPIVYLKFGQKGTFLSFPLALGVLGLITFFLNTLTSNILLIFYCIVVIELIMLSLNDSTVLSSRFQFFQPLILSIKARAQFKNEMIVIPSSIFGAGFFLYLINIFFGFSPNLLFLCVITFSTALIIMYFFFLGKKYIQLLAHSISRNIFKISSYTKIGKEEIKLLEKKLFSEIPLEVTYSLRMLEKNDPKGFDLRIKKVIQHENASVKLYCLKKVFDNHIVSLKNDVESILHKDTNPLIVGRALLSYASVSKDFDGLEKHLNEIVSQDPDVIASKLSACLLYGTTWVQEKAKKNIHDLVFSSNENERLIAAMVMQHYRHKEYLLKLLSDTSINVRKVACTNCLIVDEVIMQALFDNMNVATIKTEVANIFLSHPDLTLKVAKACFFYQKLPLQKSIITILSLLKTSEAQNFLKDLILTANRSLLKRLLKTVKATDQDLLGIDFGALLDREMKNVLKLIEMIKCFGDSSTEVIFSLLAREIEIGKQICYLILSFIYPDISFSTIDTILLKKNDDFESTLEEILLIQVPAKNRNYLRETLLFVPEKGQGSLEVIKMTLLEVLNYGLNAYIPSLRSAAIYTLGLKGFKECQAIIEEQEEALDFLIPEFKPIALKLLRN